MVLDAEVVDSNVTSFYIPKLDLWLTFTRNRAGKVTGMTGYHNDDFAAPLSAARLDAL
jgi:hypothetical protein